jgi:HEPN domain-containing protein
VSPGTSAVYRLALARRSLDSARDNFSREQWRDSALFARTSIEHATKSILACFAAVPRSHEPANVLELALAAKHFPKELREETLALMPKLEGLGMQEHILLSYGDEEHGVDPWALVDGARAKSHLALAETLARLATRIHELI